MDTTIEDLSKKLNAIVSVLEANGLLENAAHQKEKRTAVKKSEGKAGYLTQQMDTLREMLLEVIDGNRDPDTVVKWVADRLRESYKNGVKKGRVSPKSD